MKLFKNKKNNINFKLILLGVFLILLGLNVNAIQNRIDFIETFVPGLGFSIEQGDLNNISYGSVISDDSFTGDIGVWFYGHTADTPIPGTNDSIDNFFDALIELNWGSNAGVPPFGKVLFHTFNNPLQFDDQTVISIEANETTGSGSNFIDIVFLDSNLVQRFAIFSNVTATGSNNRLQICSDNGLDCINVCSAYTSFGSVLTKQNASIGNSCIPAEEINLTDIRHVYIVNRAGNGFLNQFEITNALNGTNSLPLFNITRNETILCINESGDSVTFPINIDVFDFENDTIQYGTQSLQNKNFNESVIYNALDCNVFQSCNNRKDLDFLLNTVFPTNVCNINQKELVNISQHNILEFEIEGGELENVLALNGICSDIDRSFYYRFPYSLDNVFYFTELYGMTENNEEFNLTIYNDFLTEELIKINFKVNGSSLNISSWDGTQFVSNGNIEAKSPIKFSLILFPGINGTLILFDEVGGVFNVTALSTNFSASIISFSVQSGTTIYQREFIYSGVTNNPTFGTSVINNITFTNKGLKTERVFISDSANIPATFLFQDLSFQVVECSAFVTRDEILANNAELKTALLTLKSVHLVVCNAFDNVFNTTVVCLFFPFFYILITGMISIVVGYGLSIISRELGFPISGLTWFAFTVFGTFMFNFSPLILTIISLIGVVSAIAVMKFVLMGGHGGMVDE